MRFRRIYWVTEQFDRNGRSEVTGVYTSVHDLIESGLGTRPFCSLDAGFRITLCELDSPNAPLLCIKPPDFPAAREMLKPFIETGEITEEEATWLAEALQATSLGTRPA